jgi:hypothetical protein
MRVRVLRPALNDLAAGRRFYDRQQQGVGIIFSIACSPILTRWRGMQEFIGPNSAFIEC